jgi:hypothetical protein
MALGDDIQALWDRAVHDLNAARDYYTNTTIVVELVVLVEQLAMTNERISQCTGTRRFTGKQMPDRLSVNRTKISSSTHFWHPECV